MDIDKNYMPKGEIKISQNYLAFFGQKSNFSSDSGIFVYRHSDVKGAQNNVFSKIKHVYSVIRHNQLIPQLKNVISEKINFDLIDESIAHKVTGGATQQYKEYVGYLILYSEFNRHIFILRNSFKIQKNSKYLGQLKEDSMPKISFSNNPTHIISLNKFWRITINGQQAQPTTKTEEKNSKF